MLGFYETCKYATNAADRMIKALDAQDEASK